MCFSVGVGYSWLLAGSKKSKCSVFSLSTDYVFLNCHVLVSFSSWFSGQMIDALLKRNTYKMNNIEQAVLSNFIIYMHI